MTPVLFDDPFSKLEHWLPFEGHLIGGGLSKRLEDGVDVRGIQNSEALDAWGANLAGLLATADDSVRPSPSGLGVKNPSSGSKFWRYLRISSSVIAVI